MIRDLHGTMSRETAEMGILVTATEPTSAMFKEGRESGIVKTAQGTFPKIQILWIKDWFEGKRPELPRPFEPQKLRLAARPAKPKDARQMGFTFSLSGGKGKRKGKDDTVYTDPRVALSD